MLLRRAGSALRVDVKDYCLMAHIDVCIYICTHTYISSRALKCMFLIQVDGSGLSETFGSQGFVVIK